MKFTKSILVCSLMALIAVPAFVSAAPVNGVYFSTDLGGQLLTGRASTWRSGVSSGLPHVLHVQSWDGLNLGTQWDISCPTELTNFAVQDNRVGGVGTIVYTSIFQGGTFTFYAGAWPWGNGTGTLGTTSLVTSVQYILIGGVSTPVGSVVNGNSAGTFVGGCSLVFAIANGAGAGETPGLSKPATYPTFLDGSCGQAAGNQQFGSWGTVITITMGINCVVGTEESTWGVIKELYR